MSEQLHTRLNVNPAADVFPLVEGAEFEALVEDIRSNGLQTPILLDAEGRVLDGRNRLRACRAAGVEPRFERWTGKSSPLEAVISLNVRRRHLNESQRALVAARLKEQLAGEAAKRRGVRRDIQVNLPGSSFGQSRDQAAGMLNVSPSLVQRAVKVLQSGNLELARAVESGKLAVTAAARSLHTPTPPAGECGRRFRAFYIDPPWTGPLPKQLPAMVADGSLLFLWAPPRKLAEALRAMERWGFRYQNCMVWVRAGSREAGALERHDLLLIGGRACVVAGLRDAAEKGACRTQAETEQVYGTIERLCPPGPRARLFAAPREGWEALVGGPNDAVGGG